MKKYLTILILVFTISSCSIEDCIDNICVKTYDIPEWDMSCTPELKLLISDTDVSLSDDIVVKIFSDNGELFYLNSFEVSQDTIILFSSDEFNNDDFDDYIKRGSVNLIYYN
jgi:hypothetical protein